MKTSPSATRSAAPGKGAVLPALRNASTKYRDGSMVREDRIAAYGSDTLVCFVEVALDRATLGASTEFVELAARVASVYEKIGNPWMLVHRHADPITTERPGESMLGTALDASESVHRGASCWRSGFSSTSTAECAAVSLAASIAIALDPRRCFTVLPGLRSIAPVRAGEPQIHHPKKRGRIDDPTQRLIPRFYR